MLLKKATTRNSSDINVDIDYNYQISSHASLTACYLKLTNLANVDIADVLPKLSPNEPDEKFNKQKLTHVTDHQLCCLLPALVQWINDIDHDTAATITDDEKLAFLLLFHATADYWDTPVASIELEIQNHLMPKEQTRSSDYLSQNMNRLFSKDDVNMIENKDNCVGNGVNGITDTNLIKTKRTITYELSIVVNQEFLNQENQNINSNEYVDFENGKIISFYQISLAGILLNLISQFAIYYSKTNITSLKISDAAMRVLHDYFVIKFNHKEAFEIGMKTLFKNLQYLNTNTITAQNDDDAYNTYTSNNGQNKLLRLRNKKTHCEKTEQPKIDEYFETIKVDINSDESNLDSKESNEMTDYLDTVKITFTAAARIQIAQNPNYSLETCKMNIKNVFKYFYICSCNNKLLNTLYTRIVVGHNNALKLKDFKKAHTTFLTQCFFRDGIEVTCMNDTHTNFESVFKLLYNPKSNTFESTKSILKVSVDFLANNDAFVSNLILISDDYNLKFMELFFGIIQEHGNCNINHSYFTHGGKDIASLASGGQFYRNINGDCGLKHKIYNSTTLLNLYAAQTKANRLVKSYEFPMYWDCQWVIPTIISKDSTNILYINHEASDSPAYLCGFGFEDESPEFEKLDEVKSENILPIPN